MAKKIGEFPMISESNLYDLIYLDDDNKILVYENKKLINDDSKYMICHYQKINGELEEINKWYLKKYQRGDNGRYIKREHNLLLIQGGSSYGRYSYNCTDAIYNYKEGKFIVEKGMFDCIGTDNSVSCNDTNRTKIDYLKEYGCFIGYFKLYSTKEEDDVITYINEVTKEIVNYTFDYSSDLYFALINPDGTIRGNKLFKGKNFSEIYEEIKLENYESLEEFKIEIINELNNNKMMAKKEYYEIISKKSKPTFSLYLDEEVEKVLKLK